MGEVDEIDAGHGVPHIVAGAATSRPDEVEDVEIGRIDFGIEPVARRVLDHAWHHRDPVGAVALQVHEAFRAGDLGQQHGGRERMALVLAGRGRELMRAEADPVAAVGEIAVKAVGRRALAGGVVDRAVLLLDADLVQRRIGEDFGDAQRLRPAVDARRVAGLQDLAFPHADGAAAEQQRLRRLGRRIDEDRAGGLEDARQLGAQLLAQLVVEVGQRLVEQHEVGALDQRACDRGALLLPAGQLQRRAVEIRLELQQLRDAPARARRCRPWRLPETRSGEAMFSNTVSEG